jgi:hypothetical protein
VAVGDTHRNSCPVSQQEHKSAETVAMAVNDMVRPMLSEKPGEVMRV